ncbi:hypothetical protein BCR39DRAFT_532465 [Naematelia encephala]|uniref:SnoaL-like domain-containing protein n=1 Tax=Naematelia encephala TaxID=71784 RepID=A0A1Y2B3N8_9TREE|nr:hypothetical protein BCR39DRAFT_532465 [Naematelia encephala]
MSPITREYIENIFKPLENGDYKALFAVVQDDVHWTVVNPNIKSFDVAGVYDKAGFVKAIAPLNACFPSPLALTIQHILVDQGGHTAAVELRAQAIANNAMKFDNFYTWICEFDDSPQPKIKAVRAYLDSAHVKAIIDSNH